jgi:hypothetical protein
MLVQRRVDYQSLTFVRNVQDFLLNSFQGHLEAARENTLGKDEDQNLDPKMIRGHTRNIHISLHLPFLAGLGSANNK